MIQNSTSYFDVFENSVQSYRYQMHDECVNDFPLIDLYKTTYYDTSFFNNIYNTYKQSSVLGLDNIETFCLTVLHLLETLDYETSDEYLKRLFRCAPVNIYKIGINTLLGLMLRKKATFYDNENQDSFFDSLNENIDGEKNSVYDFLQNTLLPGAFYGICGILVDYKQDFVRWQFFKNGSISRQNMTYAFVGSEKFLTKICLVTTKKQEVDENQYEEYRECLEMRLIRKTDVERYLNGEFVNPLKDFEEKQENVAAVYKVITETSTGVETQKTGYFADKNGSTLNVIPFFIFNDKLMNGDPIFYGATRRQVKLNSLQSQNDTAISIGNYPMIAHETPDGGDLPEQIDENSTDKKRKTIIKPKSVFNQQTGNKVYFVEPEGNIYDVCIRLIDKVMNEIQAMIMNSLPSEKEITKAESDTRQMNNTSQILTMIRGVEAAINKAYAMSGIIMGITEDKIPQISLNKDLIKEYADPQLMRELLQSNLNGQLSGETVVKTLVQKEILPDGSSFENEQEKLKEENPVYINE